MKPRPNRPFARLGAIKLLIQRFSFMLLITASMGLILVGRMEPPLLELSRGRVMDAVTPLLDALSQPAATAARVVEYFHALVEVYTENQQLREENVRLRQWEQAALRLDAENRSLRSLLHFRAEPATNFISARVIASPGGPFLHSVLITAGRRNGVRKGQAVMAGIGLVGRVVDVGDWSARVLLATDINTRIPVLVERTRMRAVLGGDNTDQPRLLYLPPDAPVTVGDRVVSSGHGGLFPPGLAIGSVVSTNERTIRVQLLANLSRLEHVLLLDFGLPGGLAPDADHMSMPWPR